MRQNIKRYLLALCAAICLLGLSACGSIAATRIEPLDPQTAAYIGQVTSSLLEQISSVRAEEADAMIAQLDKNKQTVFSGAVSSWVSVMNDTGAYVGMVSVDTVENEDGEMVSTEVAQFANRQVEFKVFYELSDSMLNPTAISINPVYTTGEKMAKAGMNTLLGMGTVFIVLIFISFLISCFKYINILDKRMKEKKQAEATATVAAAPSAAEIPTAQAPATVIEEVPAEENLVDDLELVAVITAAIAAASETPANGLVVRSIRRAPASKWKRA